MSAVWKFVLYPNEFVQMPAGAHIVDIAEQNGDMCAWAIVDPAADVVTRRLHVIGTGWTYDDLTPDQFVATVHMPGGLVFHVFDEGEV